MQKSPWYDVNIPLWCGWVGLFCASWFFAPLADVWLRVDTLTFYQLNQLLALGHGIPALFAYMNQPLFDWISLALLGLLCCVPGVVFSSENYRVGIRFLFLGALVAYQIKFIWLWWGSMGRVSPSLVLDVDYILPNLTPTLRHVKFMSKNCFPADHGAIIVTCVMNLMVYAKPYIRYIALLIAIFLCLPRLASGAHWLSDVLVGGVLVALMSFTLVCFFTTKYRSWHES
jgi:Kdo2-lipid A phosphotransferase